MEPAGPGRQSRVAIATGLIVLAVVLVLAIAIAVVGPEAHRLDDVALRTACVLDDAVAFITDRLSQSSQARLIHGEVQ